MEQIRELCRRIAKDFHPAKIILFGSFAHGNPRRDSDVDLMVILPFTGKAARKCCEILNRVDSKIRLDLLVRTPLQIRKRLALNDFFLKEVLAKGKLLYDASHS